MVTSLFRLGKSGELSAAPSHHVLPLQHHVTPSNSSQAHLDLTLQEYLCSKSMPCCVGRTRYVFKAEGFSLPHAACEGARLIIYNADCFKTHNARHLIAPRLITNMG